MCKLTSVACLQVSETWVWVTQNKIYKIYIWVSETWKQVTLIYYASQLLEPNWKIVITTENIEIITKVISTPNYIAKVANKLL